MALKNNLIYNLVHLKAEELIIRWNEKPINIFKGIIDLLLRKIISQKAKMVFTTSPEMCKYVIEKYKLTNVYSMPIGINHVTKTGKNKIQFIKNKYNLIDKKAFIYIGTLNRFRRINAIIDAFKIAGREIDSSLMIIGDSTNKKDVEIVRQKIEKEKISDIFFINRVPRDEVPNYIKACDIGLSVIPVNKIYYYISPTKTLEYLNEGIPVLATRIPFQEEIIKNSNSGLLCDFNVDDIAEKMIQLAKSNDLKEMGLRGQKYVRKYHTYKTISENLINCYDSLLNQSGEIKK